MIAAIIFLFHHPDINSDIRERLHVALEKILVEIFGIRYYD